MKNMRENFLCKIHKPQPGYRAQDLECFFLPFISIAMTQSVLSVKWTIIVEFFKFTAILIMSR